MDWFAYSDNEFGGRKWVQRPSVYHWKHGGGVGFSWEERIIVSQGKKLEKPHPVRSIDVVFRYNPRKWMFGLSHQYYDGPNCSLSLGPLHFAWNWWWCKKCETGGK